MRLRAAAFRSALPFGVAALAAVALPACDLLDELDGFFSQPTTQELERLRDLVGCDVEAASSSGSTTGTLSSGDCALGDGSAVDYYALKLASAADVQIELASGDFDAYLLLWDEDGEVLDEDDDGGGGTDARIARRLGAGLYLVAANAFEVDEAGRYTLRVSRATVN
jgi:hypothetical protein